MERIRTFGLSRAAAIAVAGVSTGLGLVLLWSPLGNGLVRLSYDLPLVIRYNLFGTAHTPTNEVVVIFLDEESRRVLGQPYQKPWDRSLHARLLRRLTAEGATAVVFDILFDEPGPDPEADAALAAAIKENGRVVLASDIEFQDTQGQAQPAKEILPIALLREGAAALGIARIHRTPGDDVIRQIYRGETRMPTVTNGLARAAANLVDTAATSALPQEGVDKWLNYYGPTDETIVGISYHRALDASELKPGYFKSKIVFFGGKPTIGFLGEAKDEFRSPFTAWDGRFVSGVELHALSFLNLLRRDALFRISPISESAVIVLLGGVFGFYVSRVRQKRALLIAIVGMLLVFGVAFFLTTTANVWSAWAILVLGQIPVALVCGSVIRPFFVSEAGTRDRHPFSPHAIRERASDSDRTATLRPEEISIPDHELMPEVIGRGSYGEVRLARSILGHYRAVKIIRSNAASEHRPLLREFEGIQNFEPISRSHEGFMHILHVGGNVDAGFFYYVMELADDQMQQALINPATYKPKTLKSELALRAPLPWDECIDFAFKLCSALVCLHGRGLNHRDIKPSNIIFVRGQPKLADIGLVAETGTSGTIVGTPGYLPPEGSGTPQGDIFSFGKVIYEMLTGKDAAAFLPSPASAFIGERLPVKQRLDAIIAKACASNQIERYESAAALLGDIARLRR